jgi:hypothetical protein
VAGAPTQETLDWLAGMKPYTESHERLGQITERMDQRADERHLD